MSSECDLLPRRKRSKGIFSPPEITLGHSIDNIVYIIYGPQFQGWDSAPRRKTPGMRWRFAPNADLLRSECDLLPQCIAFLEVSKTHKSRLPSAISQYWFSITFHNYYFPRIIYTSTSTLRTASTTL